MDNAPRSRISRRHFGLRREQLLPWHRDGFFYAIRLADGKIVWRIDCRGFLAAKESEHKRRAYPAGAEGAIWADGHVRDLGNCVVFSVFHQLVQAPSVLVSADKNTGKVLWVVHHPAEIEGHYLAADGILVAMAEDRKMLAVRIADGKSASFAPLPDLSEKALAAGYGGFFAGVFLDDGNLFVVGADKHLWRLPFASIKGTLDWPVAHLPSESITEKAETPQIPKRATVAAIGRHYRKQLDWLVDRAHNFVYYQERFKADAPSDPRRDVMTFVDAEIVGAAVYTSYAGGMFSGGKHGLTIQPDDLSFTLAKSPFDMGGPRPGEPNPPPLFRLPSDAHCSGHREPAIGKPVVNLWFFGDRPFVEYIASVKDTRGVERSFEVIFDLSKMRGGDD